MKRTLSLILCFIMIFSFSACVDSTENMGGNETEKPKDFLVLDEGNISVVSMQGVSGLFVEQGKQDKVENVVALTVKNNSDKMLEYGVISFRVNEYERADFKISALPAGESVLVMETLARPYSKDDKYVIDYSVNQTYFSYSDASTSSDKVKITANGSDISIKNLTDKVLSTTVVYKYYQNDLYYGGIAFRGQFENIASGETMTKTSSRFDDANCRIVNVISE